ncbi:MAG: hypothetical protein JSW54_00305 [Fidelibacterota bacterium]|nr:MAG: hypothetical protein JSW54_00305 [Candidatus Neomarinimicrobiota bacterium]
MHSDEYLKQAMAQIREPVPEELERRVLELARTTPVPAKITGFPWHWIWVLLSFLPFTLVFGIRYGHQIIVGYLPTILISGLSGITTNSLLGIPMAAFLILIVLYTIMSYRDTLRLRVMVNSAL